MCKIYLKFADVFDKKIKLKKYITYIESVSERDVYFC